MFKNTTFASHFYWSGARVAEEARLERYSKMLILNDLTFQNSQLWTKSADKMLNFSII